MLMKKWTTAPPASDSGAFGQRPGIFWGGEGIGKLLWPSEAVQVSHINFQVNTFNVITQPG